ncbi:MAG TPA: DUF1080 domain-containing protein [Gemmataceae bacterium]|nr:DUF1080 domain-containing protein [Gemmataceae bacterium]
MIYLRAALIAILTITYQTARGDDGETLFNGKDLDGWVAEGGKEYKEKGETKPVWTVEKGLLHCAGKGYGFLRYDKKKFADFAFHVEYRMAPKCNSGIGIRTVPYDPKKDPETRPSYACYEIQLLDDAGTKPSKFGSCSLYRYVAPKENAVKAAPEWNDLDIECVGPRIRITLNSKEVLDVDQSKIDEIKSKPLEGYVCLQNHGGKIDFRNVRIREIKKE